MRNSLFTLILFFALSISAQDSKRVFGTVSDGNKPIESATISVLNKEAKTNTDSQGGYEIFVEKGDKLQFSYTGMKPIELLVEDVTRVLNVTMFPEVEQLDEVVVKKRRATSQHELEMEYFENNDLINTYFGIVDTRKANFTVRVLSAEKLNQGTFFIHDALNGLIPGLRIVYDRRNALNSRIYLRGATQPAVFEVDGMVIEDINWLSINEIYRVGVIPPGIGTLKYGLRASGGMIVINTIEGSNRLRRRIDKRGRNKGSVFTSIMKDSDIQNNWPIYLKSLNNTSSLKEAKEEYGIIKEQQKNNPYFFIDSYHYFLKRWTSRSTAKMILADGKLLLENNADLLKAVAYVEDVYGDPRNSNEFYKQIFRLRPNYSQSYRDLANNYRNMGNFSRSADLYSRYNHVLDMGMLMDKNSDFKSLTNNELYNLMNLNFTGFVDKQSHTFEQDGNEYKLKGTRLVFEWNNSNAEFELEFLGKKDLSHIWKHTLKDNPKIIKKEQLLGFSSVSYLFDSNLETDLKVNLNYLGNKQLTPTYMKVTIYKNYGLRSQSSESKVFRLQLMNTPQELVAINEL